MENNKKILLLVMLANTTSLFGVPNFVLMGPPGAGKGTFADMLVTKNNYKQICPGALLRAEAAQGTPLGLSIKEAVEFAKPIDASIVCKVIKLHLEEALMQKKPFVLDGFPKNIECFNFLISFLKENELSATFIHFYATDSVCFERMVSRLECHTCGATFNEISKQPIKAEICDVCKNCLVRRKGDDHKTAEYRLNEFHENIEPVIEFIKKKISVLEVDTTGKSINYCDTLYKKFIY